MSDKTDNYLQAFLHLLQRPTAGYIYILREHYAQFGPEQVDELFVALHERVKKTDRILAQRYRTGQECDEAAQAESEFRQLQSWFQSIPAPTELGRFINRMVNSRLQQLRPPNRDSRPAMPQAQLSQLELDEMLARQLQNE